MSTDINHIELFGVRIDEPVVALTDLLVSAVCFYAYWKIHKEGHHNKAQFFYQYYFLLMGVATLFGGIMGHAFLYAFPFWVKLFGWITSMFSIMLIERAAINHSRILFNIKVIKTLQVVNLLELATFMTLSMITLNFNFVEFHSGYGLMFVVLGLEGYLYYKTKNAASRTILLGVALAAVAALFFINHWTVHPWFNYISTSHTLMAIAAWFFYRGAIKIVVERD